MRILHVSPSYLPATRYGGPIYSVHGLCAALAEQGHEVHVYTTSVDGPGDSNVVHGSSINLDGVKVWYFPSHRLRRLYYSPPMMKKLSNRVGDFDLLHLHSVFLWPTWAAARVARSNGVPYILSPRGMLVKGLIRRKNRLLKSLWIHLIEKKNLEGAAAVHVTSQNEADELTKFKLRLSRISVIANGVDPPGDWATGDLGRDVQQVVAEPGYVLFLGRLNWKKGIDRLLHAWKDVPDRKLIVAGNDEDGYLSELQRIARAEGVKDRVIFLARSITGADKEALFGAADLFVLASYSENFGITVLEAMVRSLPVVVTEEVGAAEIVRECGAGRVSDADSLSRDIVQLLRNSQERSAMGERGMNHVLKRYGWNRIGAQMVRLYGEVINA